MTKTDIVNEIAKVSNINKTQAKAAFDATLAAITTALKSGDKVSLIGFGTFSTKERAARTGRNPHTNKPMKIAAKKVVHFKAGATLKDSVQNAKKKGAKK